MKVRLAQVLPLLLIAATCGCRGSQSIEETGGVRLAYEVDTEALEAEGVVIDLSESVSDLEQAIESRLSSLGFTRVTVVAIDNATIEISIPAAQNAELVQIKKLIGASGQLEFMIVANDVDDASLIALARETNGRDVTDADGQLRGRWVNLRESTAGTMPMADGDTLRATNEAAMLVPVEFTTEQWKRIWDAKTSAGNLLEAMKLSNPQILVRVAPNTNHRIAGKHLISASAASDAVGNPAIQFYLTDEGGSLMSALTSKNQPNFQSEMYRRMAIVLNGEVISSPNLNGVISTHGMISGKFTPAEVDGMVDILNAGRLPVPLNPEPISETWVQPE